MKAHKDAISVFFGEPPVSSMRSSIVKAGCLFGVDEEVLEVTDCFGRLHPGKERVVDDLPIKSQNRVRWFVGHDVAKYRMA